MAGARLALVVSEFNREITSKMQEAALARAKKLGAVVVAHSLVPGVFDIPVVAKALALRPDVEAVVCIGAVITGETAHDELITHATAISLQSISLETIKPVALGITGPRMTEEQARERIDYAANAVEAAVKTINALRLAAGTDPASR